ncbi:unnamed protein product [Amoebophrya sp. A120]|nr:unnamed protein product [Amoebophrya sp. A120]|eukprot:GSA120T00016421001.1
MHSLNLTQQLQQLQNQQMMVGPNEVSRAGSVSQSRSPGRQTPSWTAPSSESPAARFKQDCGPHQHLNHLLEQQQNMTPRHFSTRGGGGGGSGGLSSASKGRAGGLIMPGAGGTGSRTSKLNPQVHQSQALMGNQSFFDKRHASRLYSVGGAKNSWAKIISSSMKDASFADHSKPGVKMPLGAIIYGSSSVAPGGKIPHEHDFGAFLTGPSKEEVARDEKTSQELVHLMLLQLVLKLLFTQDQGFFDPAYFHETSHEDENICNILKSHLMYESNQHKVAELVVAESLPLGLAAPHPTTVSRTASGRGLRMIVGSTGARATATQHPSCCARTSCSTTGALRLLKLLCYSASEYDASFDAVVAPEQRHLADFAENAVQIPSTGQFSEIYSFKNTLMGTGRNSSQEQNGAFFSSKKSRTGAGRDAEEHVLFSSGTAAANSTGRGLQLLPSEETSAKNDMILKTVTAKSQSQDRVTTASKRNKLHDFLLEVYCLDEARLQGRHVCQLLNFGFMGPDNCLHLGQERFWLSMESYPVNCQKYREKFLANLVQDEFKLQNRFAWEIVPHCLAMYAQMLEAVRFLQSLHIVHHDLKPDNFFVDCSRRWQPDTSTSWSSAAARPALEDFGIHHHRGEDLLNVVNMPARKYEQQEPATAGETSSTRSTLEGRPQHQYSHGQQQDHHPYFSRVGTHFPHVVVSDFGEATLLPAPTSTSRGINYFPSTSGDHDDVDIVATAAPASTADVIFPSSNRAAAAVQNDETSGQRGQTRSQTRKTEVVAANTSTGSTNYKGSSSTSSSARAAAKSFDFEIGWAQSGTGSEKARGAIELQPPEMALQTKLQDKQHENYDRRKKHLTQDLISLASDIWSCGILFYQVLLGTAPFSEYEVIGMSGAMMNSSAGGGVVAQQRTGEHHLVQPRHQAKLGNSSAMTRYMRFVLQKDPNRRPKIAELIRNFHYEFLPTLLEEEAGNDKLPKCAPSLKFPTPVLEEQAEEDRRKERLAAHWWTSLQRNEEQRKDEDSSGGDLHPSQHEVDHVDQQDQEDQQFVSCVTLGCYQEERVTLSVPRPAHQQLGGGSATTSSFVTLHIVDREDEGDFSSSKMRTIQAAGTTIVPSASDRQHLAASVCQLLRGCFFATFSSCEKLLQDHVGQDETGRTHEAGEDHHDRVRNTYASGTTGGGSSSGPEERHTTQEVVAEEDLARGDDNGDPHPPDGVAWQGAKNHGAEDDRYNQTGSTILKPPGGDAPHAQGGLVAGVNKDDALKLLLSTPPQQDSLCHVTYIPSCAEVVRLNSGGSQVDQGMSTVTTSDGPFGSRPAAGASSVQSSSSRRSTGTAGGPAQGVEQLSRRSSWRKKTKIVPATKKQKVVLFCFYPKLRPICVQNRGSSLLLIDTSRRVFYHNPEFLDVLVVGIGSADHPGGKMTGEEEDADHPKNAATEDARPQPAAGPRKKTAAERLIFDPDSFVEKNLRNPEFWKFFQEDVASAYYRKNAKSSTKESKSAMSTSSSTRQETMRVEEQVLQLGLFGTNQNILFLEESFPTLTCGGRPPHDHASSFFDEMSSMQHHALAGRGGSDGRAAGVFGGGPLELHALDSQRSLNTLTVTSNYSTAHGAGFAEQGTAKNRTGAGLQDGGFFGTAISHDDGAVGAAEDAAVDPNMFNTTQKLPLPQDADEFLPALGPRSLDEEDLDENLNDAIDLGGRSKKLLSSSGTTGGGPVAKLNLSQLDQRGDNSRGGAMKSRTAGGSFHKLAGDVEGPFYDDEDGDDDNRNRANYKELHQDNDAQEGVGAAAGAAPPDGHLTVGIDAERPHHRPREGKIGGGEEDDARGTRSDDAGGRSANAGAARPAFLPSAPPRRAGLNDEASSGDPPAMSTRLLQEAGGMWTTTSRPAGGGGATLLSSSLLDRAGSSTSLPELVSRMARYSEFLKMHRHINYQTAVDDHSTGGRNKNYGEENSSQDNVNSYQPSCSRYNLSEELQLWSQFRVTPYVVLVLLSLSLDVQLQQGIALTHSSLGWHPHILANPGLRKKFLPDLFQKLGNFVEGYRTVRTSARLAVVPDKLPSPLRSQNRASKHEHRPGTTSATTSTEKAADGGPAGSGGGAAHLGPAEITSRRRQSRRQQLTSNTLGDLSWQDLLSQIDFELFACPPA